MRTRAFEGDRWVVARVTERNAKGTPTAFWRGSKLYGSREDAEKVCRCTLPPTPAEPEPYEVVRVRDGIWGLQAAEFYEWLEDPICAERFASEEWEG